VSSEATLRAVLFQIELRGEAQKGARRVQLLRAAAREALGRCAREQGARLERLATDSRGAPLPEDGWHWSLSHTSDRARGLAAAAIARDPIGIDVERIHVRSAAVHAAVLDHRERALLGDSDEAEAFTRAWTAKEAVLKQLGLGLGELSHCRIVARAAGGGLVLERAGRAHFVAQIRFEGFLAAIAGDSLADGSASVEWTLPGGARSGVLAAGSGSKS
jgi:4'-phosphopantetheinyl transferase